MYCGKSGARLCGKCRSACGRPLRKRCRLRLTLTRMHEGLSKLAPVRWSLGCVSAVDSQGRTIWIVGAHRDDGRRFIVHADEKLSAFVELEREVLTVTFYLESIHADPWRPAACQENQTHHACLRSPAPRRQTRRRSDFRGVAAVSANEMGPGGVPECVGDRAHRRHFRAPQATSRPWGVAEVLSAISNTKPHTALSIPISTNTVRW